MKYEVKNINKSYDGVKILENINIDFEDNKTTCILGESGVGKTTLLNIIAGITMKDSGEIIGFQNEVSSFVFQEDRLIKWKNVKDNISFVLEKKIKKAEIENLIDKYLKLVNLEDYKYYYPKELSGGMRQRISILRAFIYPSKILIMDEPFKSLDINNKQIVIELFKKLRTVERRTCILVTHDIEDAIALGDKIVVLSNKPAGVKVIINNPSNSDDNNEDKTKLKKFIEEKMIENRQDYERG